MGTIGEAATSYGAMVFVAFFLGARVFGQEFVRRGLGSWHEASGIGWLLAIFGFAGAKLGGIADNPETFLADRWRFLSSPKDHAFLGALLGGCLSLWVYCRVRRHPFAPVLDALALGLPVAYAAGRMACFFHGCCYGSPSSLPWARKYSFLTAAVHPTQVYEALYALLTYCMLWSRRDRARRPGTTALGYLGLYAAGRFAVECLRVNPRYGPFSQAQWICLGLLAVTVACLRKAKGRDSRVTELA